MHPLPHLRTESDPLPAPVGRSGRILVALVAAILVAAGTLRAAPGDWPDYLSGSRGWSWPPAPRLAVAGDWPSFLGDGDRTPPRQGLALVEHLDHAPIRWSLDRHLTVGKGLYPGHISWAKDRGIDAYYGGANSPIVADGKLFYAYFRANGNVPTRRQHGRSLGWRTMGTEQRLDMLPDDFFSVTADDILIAVDIDTGELLWEAVEPDKAHNRLGHKRGHWCVTPVYADGRVFSLGTAGRLYGYDADTGDKLWETVALPRLQQRYEAHKQEDDPGLQFGNDLKSSLMVAAGKVIVSDHSLTAFDQETGEQAWQIGGRIISRHATPSPWRHDGREYLLVNNGQGTARLVDAEAGEVVWTLEGLGNQLGPVNVTGDVAILNALSPESREERYNGLFAAYRLSLEGAEKMWQLPDERRYRHSWRLDAGAQRSAAIHGDYVYFTVGLDENHLVTVDLHSGRVLDEQAGVGGAPYPMEDRLLLYGRMHTNPVRGRWWSLADPASPERLHGSMGFAPYTTTGYEMNIEWPYVDGVLYAVTMWSGIVAIDLRHPGDEATQQMLTATIPAAVAGTKDDLNAFFIQRGGELTHGGFEGAPRMHAIDTSEVSWDGRKLRGRIGIDVRGHQTFDSFDIDAVAGDDHRLSGTITSRLPAFDEPRSVEGGVRVMAHQPAWMPPADEVLELENPAVYQADASPGRLLLFLRREDGAVQVDQITGFADRTTQTPPVLDTSDLTIADGRLKGTLRARYRADRWTTPLVETGDTAAATYTIDAKLGGEEGDQVGTYEGVYGTEWALSAELK